MKNLRVTITKDQINAGTLIEIDPKIVGERKAFGGKVEYVNLYPISIQIVNDCGAEFEYNIIISEKDFADYQEDDTYYYFQRCPNGMIVMSDHTRVPTCYRFLLRGTESTATKNLYIEFINYQLR